MGGTLEALHRLQEIELQLSELRREREAKVGRVQRHRQRLSKAEEKTTQLRGTIRERQMRMDSLQLDVSAREESVQKHRQALNRARTNKEYAAILTAMNTEKADNSKIENEILLLMDEIDALNKEAQELDNEKGTLLDNVGRAEQALAELDDASQPRYGALKARRDEYAAQIAPTTLDTFSRVAAHHDGQALVPVIKLHPKRDEYVCSGCNMMLTLEIVNALQTRDDLQVCKVCGRVLYLESADVQRSRV